MRPPVSEWLSVILFALAACMGCGGTSSSSAFHDGGAEDATIGMKDSAPGDVAGFPDITFGDSGDSGPTLGCSSDLQNVVNAKGAVVWKCPPEEGCANGICVPACEAAAANKGTLGCDFVVATPSFYPPDFPPCFAVFLANNWGQAATIQASRAGGSYDLTQSGAIPIAGKPEMSWSGIPATGLPPGDVGILFLSFSDSFCPRGMSGPYEDTAVYTGVAAATGIGQAFHIVTSLPVTAYDILPYSRGSDFAFGEDLLPSAELLIPTSAWTTNYFGIVPPRGNASASLGPQWGQVVAMQDGTTVNVVPNVTLPSGTGVASAPASTVTTYSLHAGEFIQWQDSMEMSGTVISSNHPIGFTGGSTYACYTSITSPTSTGSTDVACSAEHQQIPPITALGHDYVAPPFTTRMASLAPESIPYRLVGVVDGTTLTYDPPIPPEAGSIYMTAPTSLSAGQVVEFETTLAFRVTSQDAQHPFYVGQIMPSSNFVGGSRPGCGPELGTVDGGPDGGVCFLGNEEFVNILPPEQFLQKYVFFTDVTYATTNLVFTRVKGPSRFEDVTLDCAGALTGWQPVGTEGIYEITNIDLIRANVPNGTCNNGPHTATSAGSFGIMVWGLDIVASYAYPAGGNAAPINTVVVPAVPK